MTSVIWCSRSNRPTKELRRSRSVAKAEPPVSLPYTTFVKFANVHVLPSAPFCCGNMSEPGSDQHHSRDPIRKAADHPGSATNLQCVWDRCSSAFMSAFCIFSTDCRTSPSRCVRISFQSFLIALEIVFSFSCITFSTACFPFFWFRLSHYKQSENRPFFNYLLSKCAQFSGRYPVVQICQFGYKFIQRKNVSLLTKRQAHANFTSYLCFLYVGFWANRK